MDRNAIIVEIRPGPSRRRSMLVVDDGRKFTLETRTLRRAALKAGDPIDEAWIAEVSYKEAHDEALRLLARRPCSEQEVRSRLVERGLAIDVADREVRRLRMSGLLNDEQFAEDWVERRQRRAPRAARLLMSELQRQGVDGQSAALATADLDDMGSAREITFRAAERLVRCNADTRTRRMAGLLQRRGFSSEIIRAVLRELDSEREGADSGA